MPKKATTKKKRTTTTKRGARRKFTDAQKKRIVAAAKATSVADAAKRYKVGDTLLYRWMKQHGSPAPKAKAKAAAAPKKARTRTAAKTRVRMSALRTQNAELLKQNEVLRDTVVDQLLTIKELQTRV